MPTYEYVCESCGQECEFFQRISEEPKTICEKCGGRLARLVSAGSGLIFKGSGFYITDYKRNGGNGSSAKKSGESPSSSETKANGSGSE
jgi:putative FmdB family regulatory protein